MELIGPITLTDLNLGESIVSENGEHNKVEEDEGGTGESNSD